MRTLKKNKRFQIKLNFCVFLFLDSNERKKCRFLFADYGSLSIRRESELYLKTSFYSYFYTLLLFEISTKTKNKKLKCNRRTLLKVQKTLFVTETKCYSSFFLNRKKTRA